MVIDRIRKARKLINEAIAHETYAALVRPAEPPKPLHFSYFWPSDSPMRQQRIKIDMHQEHLNIAEELRFRAEKLLAGIGTPATV